MRLIPPLSDLTGSYEWSLDLTNWNESGNGMGGAIVTIGSLPQSGMTTVTATVTGAQTGKVFVRAVATRNQGLD